MPLAIGKDIFLYENPAAVALAELDRAADTKVAEADLPARPPSELPPEPVSVTPLPVLAEGPAVAPKPVESGAAAPMAQAPPPAARTASKSIAPANKSKGWDASDFVIVLVALIVLGVSIGGLALLFR